MGAGDVQPVVESPSTYAAGIVNFRSYGELEGCLASVEGQLRPARAVVVVDHDGVPAERAALKSRHSRIHWLPQRNRGFAAGANSVLAWVAVHHPDAAFVLLLNPDVVLEPAYTDRVIRAMERSPRVALAAGKLLRPDGRTLDSAGIRLTSSRHPRDRGMDQPERGRFEQAERVFAVGGAAMLVRRAALPDLQVRGEVFDEDFFAYHEDTDLAWRASLLGWESLYVAEARAMHHRRWRRGSRARIELAVRRHSFKNRYLELIKNERPRDFLRALPAIAAWEVLRFGHCVLRDPAVLPAYVEALRLAPRAWAKRREIQRRVAGRDAVP